MRIGVSFRCIALGVALLSAPASHAQAPAAQPLRVVLSETSPLNGVLTELLEALVKTVPGHSLHFSAVPWTRAQRLVESSDMDLFVTYPADSRLAYANFTKSPLLVQELGYLIYDKQGSKARQIQAATSFADLKGLVFVHQDTVEWETEKVPSYIKRYTVNAPAHMFHMTFQRRAGDFFIMGPDQASKYAKQLGYEKQFGIRRASFIPDSMVQYHIGVRKSYPGSKALIDALDAAMLQPAFVQKSRAITAKFWKQD
jgi:polar amino acid transport system substrate-binding protein